MPVINGIYYPDIAGAQARAVQTAGGLSQLAEQRETSQRQSTLRDLMGQYDFDKPYAEQGGLMKQIQATDPASALGLRKQFSEDQAAQQKAKMAQAESMKNAMEFALKTLPSVTPEQYPQYRQHMLSIGASPALMPEQFESPEQFEQWRTNATLTTKEKYDIMQQKLPKLFTMDRGGQRETYFGQESQPETWQRVGTTPQFKSTPDTVVNVGAGESEFTKALGKETAGKFLETRDKAETAARQLGNINAARQLLDSGVITGTGADLRLGLGKALRTLGINESNDDVANTEAFISAMGSQTLQLVKNLGAGTGISDADREFAAKVAGGNISLNERSIRRILDINAQAARETIEKFNQQAQTVAKSQGAAGIPFNFAVQEPAQVTPQAAPAETQVQPRAVTDMTDDELLRALGGQ